MYVCADAFGVIRGVSDSLIKISGCKTMETKDLDHLDQKDVVGKKIKFGQKKEKKDLKIAVICNWGDQCGIATYSASLFNSIQTRVSEIKIFAEKKSDEGYWVRGHSMVETVEKIKEYGPDLVHIQHEFGIFPKATHFLKMLELLDDIPYVLTMHSVYSHLDKTICTGYIKNILVHSESAKNALLDLGHTSDIFIVTHGCNVYESEELWNIFHNDYTIVQFGFGFQYKGVDIAIDAIKYLVDTDAKFKDIFYCYLCSQNEHTKNIHNDYYEQLKQKVADNNLQENVVLLRGFLPQNLINNFIRTAKLAVFPYKKDPKNIVFGASGAIRHAMACGTPVIASDSHLFDDLDLPRITDYISLAKEIDKVFSNTKYKNSLVAKNLKFVKMNTWDVMADNTLDVYIKIIDKFYENSVTIANYSEI